MIKQMSWLDTFLVSLFLVSLLALLLALYSRPGDWSDLYGTVRKWEGFHAQAYRDIGGYSQGYGTAGHPGTTIDRATAEQLMEQELARDRAKIEAINPNLSEGSKKALSSLLYNLGGDVSKLDQHGMYEAILRNDVAAMKQAHVQFSHVHGPTGPMVQGLLNRRRDELQYYDQPARQLPRWRALATSRPRASLHCRTREACPASGGGWGQHSELHEDFHGLSQAHDELKCKLEEAKRASGTVRRTSTRCA